MRYVALCVLLCVGCSSSSKAPDAAKAAPAKPKPPPMATAEDVAKLLPASVGLPVPAAKLTFATTKAQAKAAIPALDAEGRIPLATKALGLELGVAFHKRSEQLRYVVLSMPKAAAAAIAARWGAPTTAKIGRRRTGDFWLAGGVQAVLEAAEEPARLTLWPYTPWKTLLGDAEDRFGFETTPLLGLTRGAALAAVKDYRPKFRGEEGIRIRLPRHELREEPTWGRLTLEAGHVVAVSMRLSYRADPKLRDAYRAAAAKWGEPVKTEGRTAWYGDGTVKLTDEEHALRLTLTRSAKRVQKPE